MAAFFKSFLGMSTSQEDIKQAIKAALAELMGDIVKNTVQGTKRIIEHEIEETVLKKIKQEETPVFKRKYNESQYNHSKDMEKVIDRISTCNEIEKAKEQVKEGKKKIKKHNFFFHNISTVFCPFQVSLETLHLTLEKDNNFFIYIYYKFFQRDKN